MIYFIINLKIFRTFRYKLYRDTWRNIRNLSRSGLINEIRKLLYEIHKTEVYSKPISKYIWINKKFPNHKLFLKQLFVQSLGYQKIKTMMIYFILKKKTKLIFPLPRLWQKKIEENSELNLKTSHFFCSSLYGLFLFYSILKSLSKSLFLFFLITKKKLFKEYLFRNNEDCVVIPNFPMSKSRVDQSMSEYNLINWLKKKEGNKTFIFTDSNSKKIKSYNHIIVTESINDIFLKDLNLKNFISDFFKYLLFFLIEILLLRYGSLLLMDEFFQYLVLKNSNTKKIKFLFVWENNIKRPLWSYETDEDPEIINLSNFNELRNNKENNLSYDFEGYFISNWDKYNVWTEQCKKFLNQRLKNNPKINVVGPIFSYDLGLKLELPKTKIISIFGYETHKWSCGISTIAEYQNKDLFLIHKFYSDVLDAIEGNDILLAIKRKKEFNQTLEKKYIKNIFEKLKMHPQVIYVNPKISPYRLIENTDCTISMPFTSTSVAAKFMNKNSIYYDPINQINVDDPSRCDVEVIKDKIKLTQWINLQFNLNNN
tara:strand:- start:1330 stop:2949 length:1620 start_codon:yes stop_codon:yes gene_type:complete